MNSFKIIRIILMLLHRVINQVKMKFILKKYLRPKLSFIKNILRTNKKT